MEKFEKTLDFEMERETKNTYRYREVTQGASIVQTIYIAKRALPNSAPKKLEVTIKEKK